MEPLNPSKSSLSFEDIFRDAPCGYVILTKDGLIERVNATVENWVGRSSSELAGKRLPDLLNIAGRIFYETHFAPMLKMQGFLSEIALDLKGHDGKAIQVLVNASERKNEDGTVAGTYVVIFPASERRQYERDLVAARASAEAARNELDLLNASLEKGLDAEKETAVLRDQFIAVLGHDLRNPLASISSATRILARESLSDRGLQVVDLMRGSVVRMAGLIDNVLDFARGSLGGGIGLRVEAANDLAQVLQQVVDELRLGRPDSQIITSINVSMPVECDAGRIGQLTSNLLGNAITHGDATVPVQLSARVEGGELIIAVTNGGAPIPEATIERLFQPFFRGQNQDRSQGLGLGLHIASEIAKAHGGMITVASNEVATCFIFRMPTTATTPK
jgi:sigma-B regulation protein RsbU (phosphoserine phosphatase)